MFSIEVIVTTVTGKMFEHAYTTVSPVAFIRKFSYEAEKLGVTIERIRVSDPTFTFYQSGPFVPK